MPAITFRWDAGPVNWHLHTVVRAPNGNGYGKELLKFQIISLCFDSETAI
ncbi:MAG: hypothetical protein V2B15_11100 [Bacteroidota bacterium]